MGVVIWLTPVSVDTFWYAMPLHDYLEGISDEFPFVRIKESIAYHYYFDNIRASNIVTTFLILFPKWLSALITALCVGCCVHLMARGAGVGPSRLTLTAILILIVTFVWPWHEFILTLCYSMNYLVSTLLLVIYVIAYINPKRYATAGYISGAILGFWHEGFAVAAICSSITVLLVETRNGSEYLRDRLIMTLLILPGMICLLSAPGVGFNINLEENRNALNLNSILRVIKLQGPFALFLFLLVILHFTKYRQSRMDSKSRAFVLFVCVCSVVSIAMMVMISRGYRVGWLSFVMSGWGIIWALAKLIRRPLSRSGIYLSRALTVSVCALLVWHYVVVIKYSLLASRVHEQVKEQFLANPKEPAYADFLVWENMPLITWRKPMSNSWVGWARERFALYYSQGLDTVRSTMTVLPTALQAMSPAEGELIPGSVKARKVNGYIFMQRGDASATEGEVLYTRVGPFLKKMYFDYSPFKDINGEEWVLAIPQSSYFPTFLMQIHAIDNLDEYPSAGFYYEN